MVTVIHESVRDVWHIANKRFCASGLESSPFALEYLKVSTSSLKNKYFIQNGNNFRLMLI